MGEHGVGVVDVRIDFADHPVGVDRRLVGVEQRCPLGEPLGLGAAISDAVRVSSARPSSPSSAFASSIMASRVSLASAHESEVHGVVLVDVLGGHRRMDQELAARNGRPNPVRVKPEPIASTTSAAPSHLNTRLGCGAVGGPKRQRVIVGEGALALHRRDDGNLGQFREGLEFVASVGVEDALAGQITGRLA